jgi:xylulose-5-phosphate/fructose-6-phosphate phosphoketolase
MRRNMENFRVFGPDETESNQLQALYEVGKKVWLGEYFPEDADGGELSPNGRVMEMLSEHTVEGWLEGYLLSGRHGLINSYEPFVHVIDSMFNQHAKWLEKCNELPGERDGIPQPADHRPGLWQDHNGFTHQDPASSTWWPMESEVVRIYLPPDANCLLSVGDHCLNSVNYINVIVADKKVRSIWIWKRQSRTARKGSASGTGPAMTRATNPTSSWRAAAMCRRWSPWPRRPCFASIPDVKVRFVNVVDLFSWCHIPTPARRD